MATVSGQVENVLVLKCKNVQLCMLKYVYIKHFRSHNQLLTTHILSGLHACAHMQNIDVATSLVESLMSFIERCNQWVNALT